MRVIGCGTVFSPFPLGSLGAGTGSQRLGPWGDAGHDRVSLEKVGWYRGEARV